MSGEFAHHVAELLAPLGDIRARRMFGGYGIYCGELFFALIADDVLYLKADDLNRPQFESLGLKPFRPFADKATTLPYYPAPDGTLEDSDSLLPWARLALDAARRAPPRKPKSRRTAGGSGLAAR